MRPSLFDPRARKQTVSLSINADLVAKIKNAGINASRIAEQALAEALAQRMAAEREKEIREDLKAHDAYIAEHGSFAEMARAHYAAAPAEDGDAESV